jgi:4-amino-4-deoxychorismate lyase
VSVHALVNGVPAQALDIADRGLHFGDGLFETMAFVAGRVRRLRRHLARLHRGCERLGIEYPGDRVLEADIAKLTAESAGAGQGRAVIKLIVTRGAGSRGYAATASSPTRVAGLYPWPAHPADATSAGVALRFCELRLSDQPALAGLKHLNRLEQVLARREWQDPAIAEGLLADARGHVVCGTMSNVFVIQAGRLVTPSLDRNGVRGTLRETVLDVAREMEIAVAEAELAREDVLAADEVFLTNALIGIWPARQLGDRHWEPGPLTRRLLLAIDSAES